MKLYIATSWKNPAYEGAVETLRNDGHEVFDWKNPTKTRALKTWKHILENPENSTAEQLKVALDHPEAREAYGADLEAMRWADVVLGLEPFGKSAMGEVSWANGAGKQTGIVIAPGKAELMVLLGGTIFTSFEQARAWLRDLPPSVDERLETMERLNYASETIENATALAPFGFKPEIAFDYVNYRGVAERRTVRSPRLRKMPIGSKFYPGQWVISGICEARQEPRDFLLREVANLSFNA